MNFGGGFEANASQFNGGGFMPSPGAQAGGGSAQKKAYDQSSQSVRKVTIRQLYTGLEQSASDAVIVDGKEVSNVAIVGKVLSHSDDNLTFTMVLDDGTGRINAKSFIQNADDLERQRMAEVHDGIYVRAFGHLGAYNGERQLNAFSVRPVIDHNEVTYHLSQVIFQHLSLTKGATEVSGAPGVPKMESFAGAGAPAAAAPAFGAVGGLDHIQNEVLGVFNAPEAVAAEAGLTINDVIARSGSKYSHQQVLNAVSFLVDEGHLYSTIDDAHWKTCNA